MYMKMALIIWLHKNTNGMMKALNKDVYTLEGNLNVFCCMIFCEFYKLGYKISEGQWAKD